MDKRFKILILVLIICAIFFGFVLNKVEAQSDLPLLVKEEKAPKLLRPLYVPNEIIVKFKPEIDKNLIEEFLKEKGVFEKCESKFGNFKVLKIPKGKDVLELIEIFQASFLVEYAEPNYYAYATMVPTDPLYQYQWHFDNATYGGIQMEEAWNIGTGDSSVIVAVTDTGVAFQDYPAPAHWHIDTYRAYGGSGKSWWCGLNNPNWTTPPGYGNGWKDYLQHSFDLTLATGTVTFSYYYKYDIERNYDFFYVDVSDNNGQSWTNLKNYTNKSGALPGRPSGGKPVDWTQDSVVLTNYKGKNILLRFRFNSDESYSDEDGYFNSDGAVYIDEIKLVDGSGILFYDNTESGPGTWEITKYEKAPDLVNTDFWINLDEIPDDGIDNDGNNYIDDINGWDFINSDSHPNDDEGHGTHVCGTIAQTTNNIGVAGIAFNTTIMPVKVLGADGSGTYTQVADGIYYAVNKGAKVINMSLGGASASTTLENAVRDAYNSGVTVIAASGNSNTNKCDYPAAYDMYVIAVGATQYDETKAPYSNYGPSLDIVAPGGNTSVDQNGDGYADGVLQNTFGDTPVDWAYWFYQGTSMATPHVSGVAALLLALNSTLTPDQIRNALESTADDLGTSGRDNTYGWGLVNAYSALTPYISLGVSVSPNTWNLENVEPSAEITMTSSNNIFVQNQGNVTETFSLQITDTGGVWSAAEKENGNAENKFVMSGLFTSIYDGDLLIGPGDFNEGTDDDVIISTNPKSATTEIFGCLDSTKNGVGVPRYEGRSLWLQFKAPTSTSDANTQTIVVTVGTEWTQ